MKTAASFKQKLFTPPCNNRPNCQGQGFSLVELMVASAVGAILLIIAMEIFVQQRHQFLSGRTRSETNQNLRLSMDLIGADIRQAGERLGADRELGKLSLIDGGKSGSDRLILQRQLINETLPVCQTIAAASQTQIIDVAVSSAVEASCPFSDGGDDGLTDNLKQLQAYRTAQDGSAEAARTTSANSCALRGGSDRECVYAYIHDPKTKLGEFFVYGFEDRGDCTDISNRGRTCNRIYRADGQTWQNTYTYKAGEPVTSQPVIYILEEREYSLVADSNTVRTDDFILQLRVNRQKPILIANKIRNFQVTVTTRTGNTSHSFNSAANQPQHLQSLREIQYIRVELSVVTPDIPIPAPNLTLSSQFFPRNALSW